MYPLTLYRQTEFEILAFSSWINIPFKIWYISIELSVIAPMSCLLKKNIFLIGSNFLAALVYLLGKELRK
jgi:hypothetical protein